MKIYILCPWVLTGGPESIHQLCHTLNSLSYESYIVYYDLGLGIGNKLYDDIYSETKIIDYMEDADNNIIIIPESYIDKMNYDCKSKIVIWWLSYDYGIDKFKNLDSSKIYRIVHACQSFYAYSKLLEFFNNDNRNIVLLFDYIRPQIIDAGYNIKNKQNIVAINPVKDNTSYNILANNNKEIIKLCDMNYDKIIESLQLCKVYVDFGYHPGKDRIPREAAALGCVIITNNKGSAYYNEDINIDEKLDDESELNNLVDDIYNNYSDYLMKQHKYRNNIIKEEMIVRNHVKGFINYLENNA